MWIGNAAPVVFGPSASSGASEFNRLLGGSVQVRAPVGTLNNLLSQSVRLYQPETDLERLLRKPFIASEVRAAKAADVAARVARAREASAARAARFIAAQVAKEALRQGFGTNPAVKAAQIAVDIALGGGAAAYQMPETLFRVGNVTYSPGYVQQEAGWKPFPAWPNTSIFTYNPTMAQAVTLPQHPTNHQYLYGKYLGQDVWKAFVWGRSKAIPAGTLLKVGPGLTGLGGTAKERKEKAKAAGRYRWLRERGEVFETYNTKTGVTLFRDGSPPRYDSGYGRPRGVEAKARLSSTGYRLMRDLADLLGGMIELIELLALASGWTYQQEIGGSRVYNMAYYLFIWRSIELIDWRTFTEGLFYNYFEDAFYGSLGLLSQSAAQNMNLTVGPQTGLAM